VAAAVFVSAAWAARRRRYAGRDGPIGLRGAGGRRFVRRRVMSAVRSRDERRKGERQEEE